MADVQQDSGEKDSTAVSVIHFQDTVLGLLSQLNREVHDISKIEGTEDNADNMRRISQNIRTIVMSMGERFVESQSIQTYQKIPADEVFENLDDLGKMKGDARGGFGTVLFREFRGQKVAVKVQEIKEDSSFEDEIKILRTISHDNIIGFRGWGEYGGYIYLVMEHLDKNLKMYVDEQRSDDNMGLSSRITWEISRQIVQAMYYLHSLKIPIVHADLKPDNVLLDTNLIIPKPKLCDFGLSRHEYLVQDDGAVSAEQMKDAPKAHKRYRPPASEYEEAKTMQDLMKFDVFAFGLIALFMRTGSPPYPDEFTPYLQDVGKSEPVQKVDGRYYIRKVKLPDLPNTVLGELILKCCNSAKARPTFSELRKEFFKDGTKNPFNLAEKGEFFECGFLKDTYIFVADSIVDDSTDDAYKPSNQPPGYQRENLICAVDVVGKPYHDKPEDELLRKKYLDLYRKVYKVKAKNKEIDDNPAIALAELITDRSGDDETQKLELRYKEKTYCHHRAMRDIWRSFEPEEKVNLVPCLSVVDPIYSTSFGLHVAILTNEGPGKAKKFVFTRRSNKPGMASPGSYTCGAVESCSVKDYLSEEKVKELVKNPEAGKAYVSLTDTAARGLEEELGLPLRGTDKDAITLNTIYLKFDNHEWGMCGFVDLTNGKIRAENRFSFSKLNAAFTSGPKDKFEHWQIHGVEFDLDTMVEWIRENHDKLASSAKIVVVKVLQAFFGVAPVANAFAKKM